MPNSRFDQEGPVSGVSAGQSVAAPTATRLEMPAPATLASCAAAENRQASKHGNLPTIVLPFFIVVAVAIGSVFYFHYRHVQEQKDLYRQYLSQNAWIAPMQRAFNQIQPLMDEFDQVDPSKPQDWTKIDADNKRFLSLTKGMMPTATVNHSEIFARQQANLLVGAYETRLHDAELPERLKSDPAANREARDIEEATLNNILFNRVAHDGRKHSNQEIASLRGEAKKQATAMSDDQLSKEMVQRFAVGYNHSAPNSYGYKWIAPKPDYNWGAYDNLKTALFSESEQIPEGLDLEYARKLK